jgi:hypothetical protein
MKVCIKIPDILIILLSASLVFFSAYSAYIKQPVSSRVLIRGQGSQWYFPVDAEETVVVNGPLGDTVIKIHENRAWVESSPCENKTCIATGAGFKRGQWASCLPNKVLLIIEGESDDVDTVSF